MLKEGVKENSFFLSVVTGIMIVLVASLSYNHAYFAGNYITPEKPSVTGMQIGGLGDAHWEPNLNKDDSREIVKMVYRFLKKLLHPWSWKKGCAELKKSLDYYDKLFDPRNDWASASWDLDAVKYKILKDLYKEYCMRDQPPDWTPKPFKRKVPVIITDGHPITRYFYGPYSPRPHSWVHIPSPADGDVIVPGGIVPEPIIYTSTKENIKILVISVGVLACVAAITVVALYAAPVIIAEIKAGVAAISGASAATPGLEAAFASAVSGMVIMDEKTMNDFRELVNEAKTDPQGFIDNHPVGDKECSDITGALTGADLLITPTATTTGTCTKITLSDIETLPSGVYQEGGKSTQTFNIDIPNKLGAYMKKFVDVYGLEATILLGEGENNVHTSITYDPKQCDNTEKSIRITLEFSCGAYWVDISCQYLPVLTVTGSGYEYGSNPPKYTPEGGSAGPGTGPTTGDQTQPSCNNNPDTANCPAYNDACDVNKNEKCVAKGNACKCEVQQPPPEPPEPEDPDTL